jgi:hypothetical protein
MYGLLVALATLIGTASAATPGLYSLNGKMDGRSPTTLIRYDATGSRVPIGECSFDGVVGTQETAILPETKTMYILAENTTTGTHNTILVGVSLDDASTKFEAPTPLAQVGMYIGVGQTIDYAGNGKLIVTGVDAKSGVHVAWSVDPAQGHKFTTLSSGFLPVDFLPRIDPAYTIDPVRSVLWLVTHGSSPSGGDPRLVGIDLTSGTTIANHTTTDMDMAKAMVYDQVSNKLLAFGLKGYTLKVFEIDTTTFAIQPLATIDPSYNSKFLYSGIATFDKTSRTIYGFTETQSQPSGLLLVGYSVSNNKMTAFNLDRSLDWPPRNIDYYNVLK